MNADDLLPHRRTYDEWLDEMRDDSYPTLGGAGVLGLLLTVRWLRRNVPAGWRSWRASPRDERRGWLALAGTLPAFIGWSWFCELVIAPTDPTSETLLALGGAAGALGLAWWAVAR